MSYFIDYHTHSQLSPDSSVPLEQQAEAAVRSGLSELCITDHYDTVGLHGGPMEPYDWAPAVEQFQRVRAQFQGRLTLRLGLEFGSGHLDGSALAAAPPELDFVIGSVHNRSLAAGGDDFYYGDYHSPGACYQALDDYVSSLERLASAGAYDVLGHIIYPLRYMARGCPEVSMDRYADRIRVALAIAIASGRGMELNTYNGCTLAEWRPRLALYRELGGEILSVGSDAHVPENVGEGVPEAYDLIRAAGFRYIAVYEGRKPRFVKL